MQERLADRLIDRLSAEGLTGAFGELLVTGCTDIVEGVAPGVAHRHGATTDATDDSSLQECGPLADGAWAGGISIGAIVVQALLVAEELVPGEIRRIDVMDEDRPFVQRNPVCVDLRGHTRHSRYAASDRAAIHVGPGIDRIVEHLQDPSVSQGAPGQFSMTGASILARREEHVLFPKGFNHGQGGTELLETREDQPDRLLDLFVRIEDRAGGGLSSAIWQGPCIVR